MRIAVIGSGPAGFHATRALVERGQQVTIIDPGERLAPERQQVVQQLASMDYRQWPAALVAEARRNATIGGAVLPKKVLFGSDFIYADNRPFAPTRVLVEGRAPLPTFAQGGFSTVWGGAALPVDDCDTADWPVHRRDLAPFYARVLEDMPLSGGGGSLDDAFPTYTDRLGHLDPGRQGRRLLEDLDRVREKLNESGTYYGRARLAVRTASDANGQGCCSCGICFAGCPWDAIYSTAPRVRELAASGRIGYWQGQAVIDVCEEADGVTLTIISTSDGARRRERFDAVFVGAGPINSTRLMLASRRLFDRTLELRESQKFVLPMLRTSDAPGALDESFNTLAAVFYETKLQEIADHWVHVQMTPISDLVLRQLRLQPGQSRHALRTLLAPALRRAMFCWVAMHSDQSSRVLLTLRQAGADGLPVLDLDVRVLPEATRAAKRVAWALYRQALAFRSLMVVPAMKFSNPGSGTHCGGSLPMRAEPRGDLDTDIFGRPFGWKRVFVVDSSILPSLPATTTAFTVMANAMRIAATAPLVDRSGRM
jgi:choline dehydrogenase-like flavoprotein